MGPGRLPFHPLLGPVSFIGTDPLALVVRSVNQGSIAATNFLGRNFSTHRQIHKEIMACFTQEFRWLFYCFFIIYWSRGRAGWFSEPVGPAYAEEFLCRRRNRLIRVCPALMQLNPLWKVIAQCRVNACKIGSAEIIPDQDRPPFNPNSPARAVKAGSEFMTICRGTL